MSQNPSNNTSIILYNGNLELHLDNHSDTIWASQAQIAELFWVDRTVITKHIRNIFGSDELDRDMVCANFAHTTPHWAISGKTQTKDVTYYNLDMILSIGYRVNSNVATGFRKWASARLKEYLIQGYSINQKKSQNSLAMKKIYNSQGYSRVSYRHSMASISTQPLRNKQHISSTSSSRIIHSQMATSESVLFSLCGFSRRIITDSKIMEHQKSMNQVSLPSLSSSQVPLRVRKKFS